MNFKDFAVSNKKTILISIIRILIALGLMFYAVSYKNYILGLLAIVISGLSIAIRRN